MSTLYFQDANGISAEALLCFSDGTLLLILPILFGVMFLLCSLFFKLPRHRLLTESQGLEFVWSSLPSLALVALAIPSLRLLYLLDEVGFPAATHKAVASQWYWTYETHDIHFVSCSSYLSSGPLRLLSAESSLVTYSELVLRILITSTDVLHAWAVPSFALKADAVPGRLNQLSTVLSRPGLFYGQCSEICGSAHRFMPVTVSVLPLSSRNKF